LFKSKLEEIGIKEPELQVFFKDLPKFPPKQKQKVIDFYLKIKEK
jgi:hypothetical protein